MASLFFPHLAILFLLLALATANTTHDHHNHHHHRNLKSMHFTLYQHETVNKTAYLIVAGVTGPRVSQTTTPFGTIYAFQDPLTETPSLSSTTLGVAEGTSITSSLDGLQSISVATIKLMNVQGHKGSISILGVVHNTQIADLPIVGGTGDFMFVQGYVRSSPFDLKGITVVYKIEFHLYWPPYASHLH